MKEKTHLENLENELRQLHSSSSGRRAFLTSLPFLLAACSSAEKTRYREGDNKGQETSLTVEDEKKMTQEYVGQMRKEYPAVKNQRAQNYLNNLGFNIVRANKLEGHPYNYNFTLVDAQLVNAFALPAGTIFVTAPLLKMAETEAELAGVVGHEIGHVVSRHTAERIDKAKKQQTQSVLYGLGGALLGGAGGFALGKLLCSKQDRDCLRRAAIYGAAAGGAGGLLIQKFAFMANSREDEMEADRVGFKTALRTGYHKDYVGNFYSKLLEMEKQHKTGNKLVATFSDALSTHPPSQERVDQMNKMAQLNKNIGTKVTSSEFQAIKKLV